jgi:hypothetical protein
MTTFVELRNFVITRQQYVTKLTFTLYISGIIQELARSCEIPVTLNYELLKMMNRCL